MSSLLCVQHRQADDTIPFGEGSRPFIGGRSTTVDGGNIAAALC
jgi:hypothetical protein